MQYDSLFHSHGFFVKLELQCHIFSREIKIKTFLLQGGGDDNKVSEMEAKLQQMQEEMRKMQEQLSEAKNSQQNKKTLEEIDVFQASTSRSVSNAPRSPVKSNPFAEADKPRKITQFHPETPVYGPSLSKKSTRVLSKEETVKLNLEVFYHF